MTENESGTITLKKDTLWKVGTFVFAILFVIALFTGGFGLTGESVVVVEQNTGGGETPTLEILEGLGNSANPFLITGDSACTDEEGKPYVILFSTTWCPHCTWIQETFDGLVNEDFADKINLQHWEVDIGDNILTSEIETEVPLEILALYQKYNPKGSIPTFVMGCSYVRIGNGYESQNNLNAELQDFKLVINKLLE